MSTKCHCKGPKRRHDVVCPACLAALPADLRTAYRVARYTRGPGAPTLIIKAEQAIKDHLNGTASML